MDLTLIISAGVLLGCILAMSWFAGSDAPFIPTNMTLLRKVLILAGVKKGKRFYELGSGDGRVTILAANLGALSIGIEQSLLRILYSRFKARGNQRVKLYHGNIFSRNYTDADIVYIYLLPKAVSRLEKKLKKELKQGARVITQTYHFQNWPPIKKIAPTLRQQKTIYKHDIIGAGNYWIYRA